MKKAIINGLKTLQMLEGIEVEIWEDQAETLRGGKEQHRNEGQRMVSDRRGLGPVMTARGKYR